MVEWSRALDVRLIKVITKLPNSEQSYKGKVKTHNYINRQNQSTTGKRCCSVSMVWVQIPSREEQKFDSSNSNTVWFNFQTYIYIYV